MDEETFQEEDNINETIGDSIDVQDINIVVKDEPLEEVTSEKTYLFNSEVSAKVKVEDRSISYDLKVEPKSEQTDNIIQIKDVYSESAAENSNMKKEQSSIPSTSQIPCYDVPDSDQEDEDDDIPDDIG